MNLKPINVAEKLAAFFEHWSPRTIAEMNGQHFKLVKFAGEFVWHSHADTDEAFFVLEGSMTIHFRDGDVEVGAGEMLVIPKGREHKTSAKTECKAMVVEAAGTVNTGDVVSNRTVADEKWI